MEVQLLVTLGVAVLGALGAFFKVCWDMLKDVRIIRKEQIQNTVNTNTIRSEVKNSHTINLREDIDVKHDELISRLNNIDNRFLAVEERLSLERAAREANRREENKMHESMWRAINKLRKV